MRFITRVYHHFANDSLYRNSIYLMASTFMMAVFGFFFWIINARLFTTEQVGLATTMISVMGLITSFSLLGLNTGLIRYLPMSERKNDKISTCFSVTALVTIIISIVFLLGLKTFSPRLLFIRENLLYTLFFIFFMVISSSSNLLESIYIAFRDTKFVFIQGAIFSTLKLTLPFFLVGLGTYGIFGSSMGALTIGFFVSFIILITKFGYKLQFVLHKDIIRKIGRFSFGNYIAGFMGGLPAMTLPLLITNKINPETTAHYYMAMMIANLLFVIPQATTQSLFAEGSHNEGELKQHIKKAIRIIALILIPAILITVFFGKYILLVFGKDYSNEGFKFLQLLAISGVFVSFNSIFGATLRVNHKIKKLIFISLLEFASILGLSYLLIAKGLLGIGWAWIIGQGLVCLAYLGYEGLRKILQKKQIWSIGIYICESPLNPTSQRNAYNPVLTANDVTDVSAEFVADPFIVRVKSDWYMFFEVMNKHSRYGEIGVATSKNGLNWEYKQIVLKESFHLSYPYVFEWQNEYYMIPESHEVNSIRLYKAVDFPTRWLFEKTLLDGKDFVDSSILRYHKKWWLFTSTTRNDVLYLYYCDRLTGSWAEHPKSPVISRNANIARPAGRVLLINNHIIRYAQDDIPTYGSKVRAFEITNLSTTAYKEKEVNGNPILKASGAGWNGKGMHHLDPHQIGENEWIICTDGNMEIVRFGFN